MRTDWVTIHFSQAFIAAKRGTCPRLKAGIVLVDKNHQVVGSGYNGSLSGMTHCNDVGCLIVDGHCIRTLHSEENAIAFATRNRQSLVGTEAFITARPCQKCTKLLIQVGVRKIYYWKPYNTDGVVDQVEEMLRHAGVPIIGPMWEVYPLQKLFDYSMFLERY